MIPAGLAGTTAAGLLDVLAVGWAAAFVWVAGRQARKAGQQA